MAEFYFNCTTDPTLEAVDKAIEEQALLNPQRGYLGFSSIGHPCKRKLWYSFRNAEVVRHNAETIKRFEDGFAGEDLQAKRLRMVPGIELTTHGPDGKQIGWSALGGHFNGHCDGIVKGLLQAPATAHIWEHKSVGIEKFNKMKKLKAEHNEKGVLELWDGIYYCQAILYMLFSGLERHYLTCSTPGGRDTISVRTNADNAAAKTLIAKAESIIFTDEPPLRVSDKSDYYLCGWCEFKSICHGTDVPLPHCKSCTHSTAEKTGGWSCAFHKGNIPNNFLLLGCSDHRYLPPLLANFADYQNGNELKNIVQYLNRETGNFFYNGEKGMDSYPSTEIYAAKDKRALGDDGVELIRKEFGAEVVA